MKLLIRYIKKQGLNDAVEETIIEANQIKVGRGSDQNILLADRRVALAHLKINIDDHGIKLSTASGKYVLFKERMVRKCSLNIGDEFDILGHVISLKIGDNSCDFTFEIKLNNIQQAPLKERYQTSVYDLKLSKRRWSWLLFLTIFFCCLLIPALGLYTPAWMDILRSSPLPDDNQWNVGKLIKSHQFMGDNCNYCHVEPFVKVNNNQCQSCHKDMKHHVDTANIHAAFSAFEQCTDCHKEHNPQETLAQYSQQVCVICHSDITQLGLQDTQVSIVTDFEKQHPAFKASMLIQDRGTEQPVNTKNLSVSAWLTKRISLADKSIKEQSNLKFSHKLHMDPQGILSATETVKLECSNCHVAEKSGWQMKPITMEKNCQSCHQLTFDTQDPSRVVPHGSPTEVVLMMREYYAFRYIYQKLNYLDGNAIQTAGDLFDTREARRPGRDKKLDKSFEQAMDAQAIASIEKLTKDTVRTDALVWAESRASNAAFSLFERQACAVCHVVSKNDNAEIPWHVEPVRLTENWLPNAIFNHNKHQTMACTNCHAGDESEHSHDILIPDIGNCQQCHGGEESTNLIPNTCIDCHGFHEAKIETFNQPRFKNISQAINSPHKNTPEVKGEKGIDRDE